MKVCRSPARHLGIRAFQDIFTTHEDRLFHLSQRLEGSCRQ
jgi:hypothetical protein